MASKSDTATGCWPTTTQEYLLKAVLLKDKRAHMAWKKWLSCVDFFEDKLTGGSYHLLPLVYKNFQALRIDDPLLGRLKGVVRNTWTHNQMLLKDVMPALRLLDTVGIQTLILGRAALILATYEDTSICLMDAFDVFVSPSDTTNAFTQIQQTGIWSAKYTPSKSRNKRTSNLDVITFYNKQGQHLNLHLRFPLLDTTNRQNQKYLACALPTNIQGVDAKAINPDDQILALCLDGLLVNRVLAIDWIAHVSNIINKKPNKLDWSRLINKAQTHHLVLALRHTLHYIHQAFGITIPVSPLAALDECAIGELERREWNVVSKVHYGIGARYNRLRRLWYGYMRVNRNLKCANLNTISSFYHFLLR